MVARVMGDPGMYSDDSDDGALTVGTTGGETFELTLSRHHVGGYWRRAVTPAHSLLDQVVRDPDTRTLLSRPDALLAATTKAARGRP